MASSRQDPRKKTAPRKSRGEAIVPELDPDMFEMSDGEEDVTVVEARARLERESARIERDTDRLRDLEAGAERELEPERVPEELTATEVSHDSVTPASPTARAPGWEQSAYRSREDMRAARSGEAPELKPDTPQELAPLAGDYEKVPQPAPAPAPQPARPDRHTTRVPESEPKPQRKRTGTEFTAVNEAAKELARAALAAEIEKEEKRAMQHYTPEEGEIPPSPEVAKRFDVILQLGKGGMAVVYLCRDPRRGGRVFAVKDIRAEMKPGMKIEERVESEANLLKGLNHPGIVKIYDLLKFQRGSAIVMEYIDGLPLDHEIGAGRRISWDFGVRVLREIGKALQYAHERGVIHRDIKPDNILWSERHNVMKLVDFGLARMFGDDTEIHMTRTGMVVGTPHYMSPEQVSGKPLDGRSDQYSFGATLYYLLTGQRHVEGSNIMDILEQQRSKDITPPSMIQHDVPAWVSYVIGRMMELKPADRYADMNAVLKDLDVAERNPEAFLADAARPAVKRFGNADLLSLAREENYFGSSDDESSSVISHEPFHSERMTRRVPPRRRTTRSSSEGKVDSQGQSDPGPEIAAMLMDISNRLEAAEQRAISPGMLLIVMLLCALLVVLGTVGALLFVLPG